MVRCRLSLRGTLLCMASEASLTGDVVLAVRPVLTDTDLNELFSASWPGHQTTSFEPKLARGLTWIAARREGRLVGYVN